MPLSLVNGNNWKLSFKYTMLLIAIYEDSGSRTTVLYSVDYLTFNYSLIHLSRSHLSRKR